MRSEDCERRHHIDRQRRGNVRRQGLHKERDTTLGLASRREKLALEALVVLRDEERWRTKATTTTDPRVDLMIKELLDVVDGEQVFVIHGNDNGVPDLRDEDLEAQKTEISISE